MKRIEKIHSYVKLHTDIDAIQQKLDEPFIFGISSIDIEKELKIQRSNASFDLNKLYRDKKLLKIKGNPMKFLDSEKMEKIIPNLYLLEDYFFNSPSDLLQMITNSPINEPFSELIGYNGSLFQAIQTAKASILYPPNGLHSLLLGESGVGKSLFAEVMFKFGKKEGIFSENAPFIRFNCADYSDNPQLLLNQLFGNIKGAYTGADKDKKGIVELANNGVLFLDEIHRLPAIGQEMLFHLIDNGTYRRLGEAENTRSSKLMIIGATTEIENNNLLTTFLRRIPTTIWLPSNKERPMNELLSFIKSYLKIEVNKVKMNISISRNALWNLLNYNSKGNLGQLKSDLQLAVAKGFLETTQKKITDIQISTSSFPEYIQTAKAIDNIESRQEFNRIIPRNTLIIETKSSGSLNNSVNVNYDFVNFYMKHFNLHDTNIDINAIFNEYINKNFNDRNTIALLPEFFSEETKLVLSTIVEILYTKYSTQLERKYYFVLSLFVQKHMSNPSSSTNSSFKKNSLKTFENDYYSTSLSISRTLEKKHSIFINTNGIDELSLIIKNIQEGRNSKEINYIILSHGNTTATSLSNTINSLLDTDICNGIDMPLTRSINEIEKMIKSTIDSKDNVDWIFFYDMGAFKELKTRLNLKGSTNVFFFETNNILIILESVKTSISSSKSIEDIITEAGEYHDIINFQIQNDIKNNITLKNEKIIYTICQAGESIGLNLKNSLDKLLKKNQIFDVDIIALSGSKIELFSLITESSKNKQILGIIGNINLNVNNIPYISMNDIFQHQGINKLLGSILNHPTNLKISMDSITKLNKEIAIYTCIEALDKYLDYLSASKMEKYLRILIQNIEEDMLIKIDNKTIMRLMIHIGCAIEKNLMQNTTENMSLEKKIIEEKYNLIKKRLYDIEKEYNMKFTLSNIQDIYEIIHI